jgi:hypothetical protein
MSEEVDRQLNIITFLEQDIYTCVTAIAWYPKEEISKMDVPLVKVYYDTEGEVNCTCTIS